MMILKILLYGVSHKSTPIQIREKYVIPQHLIATQYEDIAQFDGVTEVVILSTCNRTEYYLYVDETTFMHGEMLRYIAEYTGFDVSEVISTSYGKSNNDVGEHLFHVTTGLDSLMIGETQILGQVKKALAESQEQHAVGPILSSLFNKAIAFAKRMHTTTKIDQVSFSPSTAAVKIMNAEFEDLIDKRIVLVGAGEMIQIVANQLAKQKVEQVSIVNRTLAHAEKVSDEMNEYTSSLHHPEKLRRYFSPFELKSLPVILAKADVVVVAAYADEYLVTPELLEKVAEIRKTEKSLLLLDLSVPRMIDPKSILFEGCTILDMDQISAQNGKTNEVRDEVIKTIKEELEKELEKFSFWYRERKAVPYLNEIRNRNNLLKERTMKSIEQKLSELSPHEIEVIEKHMTSIINHLSRSPIQAMKEAAKMERTENKQDYLDIYGKFFGLKISEEQSEKESEANE